MSFNLVKTEGHADFCPLINLNCRLIAPCFLLLKQPVISIKMDGESVAALVFFILKKALGVVFILEVVK
ncbi:MAG: hypothetical protein ACJAT7_002016 [Psychromonas sp.]|jgi:hypothetical protein